MQIKITKRTVDAIKPAAKDQFLWDKELHGFGVKVTPTGKRIYILQYRMGGRNTPSRRYTIGHHGPWTPEKARKEATDKLGDIAKGNEPVHARTRGKGSPSLQDVGERYLTEYAVWKKKPRSLAEDRRNLHNHVYPLFGSRPIKQITHEDIERLHHRMHHSPYAANRTVSLLSMVFKKAEKWNLRTKRTNPCRDIEKYKENKRERRLSVRELTNLGRVLRKVEDDGTYSPYVLAAIRLLLLTGARLQEILTLKWTYIDDDEGRAHLPDSKTGPKPLYLNTQALQIINSIPRLDGNPYVLPGQKPGRPLVNLHKAWFEIRQKAGLDDVRLHDLRRSYGSIGVDQNMSLPIVGGLLGHREASTTQRYARLDDAPLKQAAEVIGKRLESALSEAPPQKRGRKEKPLKPNLQVVK